MHVFVLQQCKLFSRKKKEKQKKEAVKRGVPAI